MQIVAGERFFADVNGDGKAELIVRTTDGSIRVYSATADLGQWTYGYSSSYRLWLADVNGDGKADLVSENSALPEGLQVALSTGSAFASPVPWGG